MVTAVSRTAETLVAPYSVLTDPVVATIGNQLALVYVYGAVDPGEALVAGAGVVADHVDTCAVPIVVPTLRQRQVERNTA